MKIELLQRNRLKKKVEIDFDADGSEFQEICLVCDTELDWSDTPTF